jgi:hypothetical protein
MNRSLRFKIVAPLALALALVLAPAAQAGNAAVCQKAKAGHAAFTEDYEFFIRAFTAENSGNADQWTDVMRGTLALWRQRMLNTRASTPKGWRAREAVLHLIKSSRLAVVNNFIPAVELQREGQRDGALDFFTGGQVRLARAAKDVLPRLRAIGCGGAASG